MNEYKVTILGAGLAGCEAALWLAGKGVLTLECHGEKYEIHRDQVFKFETDQEHVYRNTGKEKACCTCFFLDYH